MRSVKEFISVILIAALTLAAASCGKAPEKGKTQSSLHGKPEENVVTQSTLSAEEQLNKEKLEKSEVFYVMVGTDYDGKTIRLRSFKGVREENAAWADRTTGDGITHKYKTCGDVNTAWWEHDPNDYEYGDIFIANGIEPGYREVEFYQQTIQEMVLDSNVQLEKVGNCKDLMQLRKAKLTDVSYAGYEFWDVSLKYLDDGTTNGYNFRNNAAYYVEITSAEPGDIYLFACLGDVPVIPMEKVG